LCRLAGGNADSKVDSDRRNTQNVGCANIGFFGGSMFSLQYNSSGIPPTALILTYYKMHVSLTLILYFSTNIQSYFYFPYFQKHGLRISIAILSSDESSMQKTYRYFCQP